MKNLIEQASTWLQSDACRSGNIIERTKAVVSAFRSYVHVEEQEICTKTGLKLSLILDKIDTTEKTVCQILSAFLRGNQQDALMKTYKMMKSMKLDKISPGIPMYKCRENSKLFHFSKDEMFHIPYNKRNLVGNQRFSLSGLPCLYLGGSSYICWEELGRTELNSTNYCGYSLGEDVKMFDFLLPIEITNPHQIRKIVLILACSLAASRDSIFKPEYILSQSILHTLIYRSYYSHSQICLRFYSSHLLNGDADYFNADYDNKIFLARYVNYVFPAASSKSEGYSDDLRKVFNQTETISLLHETILNPERQMISRSGDVYLSSQFGLIDAVLDEKLGFKPKRDEGELFILRKE